MNSAGSALPTKSRRQRRKDRYRLIATAIGFIIGVLSLISSYAFGSEAFPNVRGNPLDLAFWFLLYGAMILLGSSMVYTKRLVPIGALLILLPSFLVAPQSFATTIPGNSELKYTIGLILGWILPVIGFGFALLSIERPQPSPKPKVNNA